MRNSRPYLGDQPEQVPRCRVARDELDRLHKRHKGRQELVGNVRVRVAVAVAGAGASVGRHDALVDVVRQADVELGLRA